MYTVVFGVAFTLEAEDEDAAVDAAQFELADEFGLTVGSFDRFFVDAVMLEDFEVN